MAQFGTPLSVLLVTDADTWGGAEVTLATLAQAIDPVWTVSVLGRTPEVVTRVARSRPGTRICVPEWSLGRIRTALRALSPDVMHVNLTSFTACRPAIVAALSLRIPTILVDHAPTAGLTAKGRLVQRLMTRLVAARVSVTHASARAAEHFGGLPPGTVLVIHNGIPQRPPIPEAPERPPVVAAIARLSSEKGIDLLLRALPEVSGVRLVVAGDGPERESLARLASHLAVADRVEFLGWLEDVRPVLGRSHIVAVPSRSEAQPLVLLEAMQARRAVVATQVGGMPEVIADGAGIVVPPNDPSALGRAIGLLVDDPVLRRAVASVGCDRIATTYSADRMARGYEDLYRAVCRPRR